MRAEIEAIAGNPATPTIENTLAALELCGDALDRVSSIFWCRAGAHTNDAIQAHGARDRAEDVAAFLGDLDERGAVRPHRRPLPAPRRRSASTPRRCGCWRRPGRASSVPAPSSTPTARSGLPAINEELASLGTHVRPERARRREGLGAVPRRGRPRRPARLPAERRWRRPPRRAASKGTLRGDAVALDLRALHHLFRAPRPAREGLPRLHHARREWRRHRQSRRSCARCWRCAPRRRSCSAMAATPR